MPGASLQQVQRLGLQQVLAPHMQLSLRLLQAATVELCDLIKQELDKNPTLEEVPQEMVSLDQPSDASGEPQRDGRTETDDFRKEFETLKEMDDEWRDYFTQSSRNYSRSAEDDERRQFFFDSIVQPESLQQHLLGQLGMIETDDEARRLAETIIGSLGDDGYLFVHEDLGEALVDFALQACAGQSQASPGTTSWARALIEGALTKTFERSKRGQLIGWRERLQAICEQILAAKPEQKPLESKAPETPGRLGPESGEPVKETVIELGREAVERLRQELGEGFRAVINEGSNLPVPKEVFLETVGAGLTAAELDAVLQPTGRLELPLLFLRPEPTVTMEAMHRALELVQTFHPVGVGARNLCECLLIQLARLDKGESLEARIIRDHLHLLIGRDVTKLVAALGVPQGEVQQAVEGISRLEPKPGRMFSTESNPYVEPDVVVAKDKDGFSIILNDERVPHLRISDTYREMMGQESVTEEVVQYVRERIQAGKFLIRSIIQRQQTIYNIASEILRAQREFFEKGPGNLRPLRMSDVAYRCGEEFKMVGTLEKAVCPYCGELADVQEDEANRRSADCPNAEKDDFNRRRHRSRAPGKDIDNPRVLGVHETTVSRAIANKYMATPHGVFEMKYFFTPGYTTASGEAISSQRVKDLVKELVDNENPAKPLSDQEISAILKKRGLDVARRTVAKYRSELNVPSSNLRVRPGTAPVAPPPADPSQPTPAA